MQDTERESRAVAPPLPELGAVAARLFDEARDIVAGRTPEAVGNAPRGVLIVGDADGALPVHVGREWPQARITTVNDELDAEIAVQRACEAAGVSLHVGALETAAFAGAELVLAHMPKANDVLRAIAALAAGADARVTLVGSREKYLTRGHNELLAEEFDAVRASLGKRKSRVLVASRPKPRPLPAPRTAAHSLPPKAVTVPAASSGESRQQDRHRIGHGDTVPSEAPGGIPHVTRHTIDEPDLELHLDVVAVPGAFAGAKLDIGTRALLRALRDEKLRAELDRLLAASSSPTVVDLGCGTGILATVAALSCPSASVVATDRSAAAVASARATAAANGVAERVHVERDVAASRIPDHSVDLVLCNPPFHDGTAVVDDLAAPIFAAARRILKPGGVLLAVFNSHLPHRHALARTVGPTEQLARDAKFTVTRSVVPHPTRLSAVPASLKGPAREEK